MSKSRVLIVGYGIVGEEMVARFGSSRADIVDPFKPGVERYDENTTYDAAFICVPTPEAENGSCDTSLVKAAVLETVERFAVRVVCIKSTVAPGFTDAMVKLVGVPLAFSPEFSGITRHVLHDEDFTIIGGEVEAQRLVSKAFLQVVPADHRFIFTDAVTAELSKYMVNSFLATKVTFCNEFARIAGKLGVGYEQLRQCFISDPRIGASHTIVFEDAPYYESKCFDKDIPAIICSADWNGYDAALLRQVEASNKRFKAESR